MSGKNIIDNISSNLSIRIKRSYCTWHGADWSEQRTKIDYTLWNVMSGNIYLEVDGISYTATKGDVILFYPGTSYTASTDADGCQFLYNRFSVEVGNGIDILNSMELSGIIPSRAIGKKCADFCKQFMNLYSMSQNVPFKLYSVFISYLSDIIDLTDTNNRIPFSHADIKVNRTDPIILSVMEYIDEHFCEDLTISQLSKKVSMSEKYFISCFKKIAGISPGQYIMQCRMKKAAHLLLTTDMKVHDISAHLGYANPYTFSNTFKKFYEESPLNFKNHLVY